MTDRDESGEMLARAERAREREARALEHEHEAERKAAEAIDPVSEQAHRAEAETHARAAQLQHEAVEFQTKHARTHGD